MSLYSAWNIHCTFIFVHKGSINEPICIANIDMIGPTSPLTLYEFDRLEQLEALCKWMLMCDLAPSIFFLLYICVILIWFTFINVLFDLLVDIYFLIVYVLNCSVDALDLHQFSPEKSTESKIVKSHNTRRYSKTPIRLTICMYVFVCVFMLWRANLYTYIDISIYI